jgi:uncharacterized protein YjiS (DUF1127 family)
MKGFNTGSGKLRRIARRLSDWHDRQRAIRELCIMPGWRLADMGIERARIPEIVDALLAQKAAAETESVREHRPQSAFGQQPALALAPAPEAAI